MASEVRHEPENPVSGSLVVRWLDRLEHGLRRSVLATRLAVGTRILLAAGFLPTGMVKLLDWPFTTMDPATDIGLLFHALHTTGLYWRFLGASQVAASVLILVPATAHLGALLFLPVMVNIVAITLSLDFRGTPVVTGMMLLATMFLLVYDFHRWRGLLSDTPAPAAPDPPRLGRGEVVVYGVGAVTSIAVFAALRDLLPRTVVVPAIVVGGVAGVMAVAMGFLRALQSSRRG